MGPAIGARVYRRLFAVGCALLICGPVAVWAQPAPADRVAPATSPHDAPADGPDAEAGRDALTRFGCLSCHSLDGREKMGPTFADRWGGLAAVTVDGRQTPVPYDRAYLARALAAPDGELAVGYPPGRMPAYTLDDETIDQMAAALAVAGASAPEPPETDWWPLLLGILIFVPGHFLLSSGPVRGRIAGRTGDPVFQLGYSIVAAVGMVLMIIGLDAAPHHLLWVPPTWSAQIPLAAMPVAFLLWVMGFTTPGPTTAGKADTAKDPVKGIHAVTRHPALWGFALWSVAHIPPNGDLATVLFFGAFAVLSFGGMWHIDRRRARQLGPAWDAFAAQTSVIPFAAMISGRARLVFGPGDIVRVVVAGVLYVGALHTHHLLFGVPVTFG